MTYTMTWATRETIDDLDERVGRHNDPPPNLKEVTFPEIVTDTKWRSYAPTTRFLRQIRADSLTELGIDPGKYSLLSVTFEQFYDGTGVGYSVDYWAAYHAKKGTPDDTPIIRWFTWAECIHENTRKTIGNCLNRYTCTKCGFTEEIDSSG